MKVALSTIVFLFFSAIVNGQDTIWLLDNSRIAGEIIELKETSLSYKTNDTTIKKVSVDKIALIKLHSGATFTPASEQKKLERAYKQRNNSPRKPVRNFGYANTISVNQLSLLRRTVNISYEHRILDNQLGFRVPVYAGYPLLRRENQFAVKKFSTGLDALFYVKSSTNAWMYVGLGFEAGEYYDIYDDNTNIFGGFNPPVNYSSIDDVALSQFWSALFCFGVIGQLSNSFTMNLGVDFGTKFVYNRSNVKSFAELGDQSFGFFGGDIPSTFLVNSFNPAGRLQFGIGYNF